MNIDIKKVAKAHGVSIVALAERLGVSRQTVHYYCEQGDKNPLAQLERIAAAIGCRVSEFFDGEDGSDFIAFVRNHGDTHTFDTPAALIEYADGLKGETDPEAPAAPSASTAPDLFEDPIFR